MIVPDLVSGEGEESVLRQPLATLANMAELGDLRKLTPLPQMETPEALFLGMGPGEVRMAQGPLSVAAFGADPPERSTHFHLSLLTLEGNVIADPALEPSEEELRKVLSLVAKLNTKSLTFVAGEGRDHALVWEGLGDMATHSPKETVGRALRDFLPEGDAEPLLRRFIDDSINLLSEGEWNVRRMDEGLPPFNLLWPWGHGMRVRVPNLALRKGEPVQVESESIRMAGLARLAGYRHGNRHWLRHGLNLDLGRLAEHALNTSTLLAVISAPAQLREKGQEEELEWFVRRLDTELLSPLFDAALRGPRQITLLAPSDGRVGLALSYAYGQSGTNTVPFDERALSERTISAIDLSTAVDDALS